MEPLTKHLTSGMPVAIGILEAMGVIMCLWVIIVITYGIYDGSRLLKDSPPKRDD